MQETIKKEGPLPLFSGKNSIWVHVITWVSYLLLSTFIFIDTAATLRLLLKNIISAIFYAIPVYLNIYAFVPRYFSKGYYIRHYGIITLLVIIIVPIIAVLQAWILGPSDQLYYEYFSIPHFAGILVTATFLLVISTSAGHTFNTIRTEQLRRELATYKLEAELRFLKMQVNPHFLFNSLNNIYTLAVMNSEKTAPTVLKLSDMMRYMIYESNAAKVPLDSEIAYLNSYIELQQLKTARPQQISFEVEGNSKQVQIEPMLFIPFFENSFKHGNVVDTKNGWLKSHLKVMDKKLIFDIKNSIAPGSIQQKDKVGGIGLENVRKRLDLLYKNKHELTIIGDQPKAFSVYLEIDL